MGRNYRLFLAKGLQPQHLRQFAVYRPYRGACSCPCNPVRYTTINCGKPCRTGSVVCWRVASISSFHVRSPQQRSNSALWEKNKGAHRQRVPADRHLREHSIHSHAYMAWSPAATDRGEDERFASIRAGPIILHRASSSLLQSPLPGLTASLASNRHSQSRQIESDNSIVHKGRPVAHLWLVCGTRRRAEKGEECGSQPSQPERQM
ncbi:hypothetical protein DL98DRAFT_194014 [Cadophora sp. DSE1049]|nr:hypothetical protein DL98DRAFT_194014 [Cadophora sp. DSE1049]